MTSNFEEKALEYCFKSSKDSEITSVFLDDYRLILRKGSVEDIIPYASIIAVRVSRSNDLYCTYLYPDAHRVVAIQSKSVSEDGHTIDQSTGYSLLIRVLHHHLKEKSQAVFRSGNDPQKLWFWVGAMSVLAFMASSVLNYLGLGLLNPYMQALLFSAVAAIIVIFTSMRKLPRNYHPGNIPLQFLP